MKLLFLCTHNACRSIIAEVIAGEIGDWSVASAGAAPSGRVNPLALQHLARRGYTQTNLSSDVMSEYLDWQPDAVITLCANALEKNMPAEQCVIWPLKTIKVHWGMDDPSQITDPVASEQAFNSLIDELQRRFEFLKTQNPQSQTEWLAALTQAIA